MAPIIQENLLQVESDWQKELAKSYTAPESLLQALELDPRDFQHHAQARRLFPMRVPRPFVRRMEKGNPNDPLLRQVLPLSDEFIAAPGYSRDPLEEQQSPIKGMLHKYRSRVLLIVRGGCAVNCRYCFRRHFPYGENSPSRDEWQQVLDYIHSHPEIDEVILSGGDPLMAKDHFLAWLHKGIEAIEHVTTLRIHTRLPVVLPQRIDDAFIDWFTRGRLHKVLVTHINHANEIDTAVAHAMARLKHNGVTLLNQAVLLKGVNDATDEQAALSRACFNAGIMPYYLHLLDKVEGASHFETNMAAARAMMAELIRRLPGYLVPKLVREIGGQPGKTPVDLRLHP